MKYKTLFIAALVAVVAVSTAQALPESRIAAIKKTLADVPPPEMAAKAAVIVAEAKSAEKEDVAIEAVRAVLAKRPVLAPAVVGTLAKAFPTLSAVVSAEAAKISPTQAEEIVRAATSAAPDYADKIVAAVVKEVPKSAVAATRAAVSILPSAFPQILESVLSGSPEARTAIESDSVIAQARVTRRSVLADGGDTTGNIVTFPGQINGAPGENPTAVSSGQTSAGSDPKRAYGSPN